jgi:hypothetical protein
MSHRLALVIFATVALLACNREKEVRNRQCGEFSAWSNHVGDPLAQAVPDSEKAAADTNDKQSAVYRKLAAGARKSAQTVIPFTDPYVKDLAARQLKIFDDTALALEHEADAWAKGDKDAEKNALQEEMGAKAAGKPLMDEWLNKCSL